MLYKMLKAINKTFTLCIYSLIKIYLMATYDLSLFNFKISKLENKAFI